MSGRLPLREVLKRSALARVAVLPKRYRAARQARTWSRAQILRWLATSRESTNYTYELTPTNEQDLTNFVARVLDIDPQKVSATISELHADELLARHVAEATRRSPYRHLADPEARYGRRAGWYAFVRLAKPRLIVETGVDKGFGACVFASALLRNAKEGDPGRYVGMDINPSAGWLIGGPYAEVTTILYGDSLRLLRELPETVDLFLHDSDHSPTYERAEYDAVAAKLAPRAIVLSDNARATGELEAFAAASGRAFAFWREEAEHWYPGDGIGVAWQANGSDRPLA